MIEIKNLDVSYGKNEILKNISFNINKGEVMCILGENGAGKSTLLKSILNLIKKKSGQITIDNIDISKMTNNNIARYISYIPQVHIPAFDFTVVDVILMGNYSKYNSFFKKFNKEDFEKVINILRKLGIEYLANKNYRKISGGERQLVLISRALLQANSYILMDEPVANLDYGNQLKIMEVCKKLKNKDIGVVITTHNPNHAFTYGDKVLVVKKDYTSYYGKPSSILTEKLLSDIYKIPIEIIKFKGNKICNYDYEKYRRTNVLE